MADFNVERLTEKLSQLGEILDGIRAQNALNMGETNKTLSSVTDKLMKLDDLSTDECSLLITELIGELKKNLDDKYSLLNIKFTEIESQFKNLIRLNESNIEQNQIKDLFDIISTNLNVFSKQIIADAGTYILTGQDLLPCGTRNRHKAKRYCEADACSDWLLLDLD